VDESGFVPKYLRQLDFVVGTKDTVVDEAGTHGKEDRRQYVFNYRMFLEDVGFIKKTQKENDANTDKETHIP
jgi:hypothetical protein